MSSAHRWDSTWIDLMVVIGVLKLEERSFWEDIKDTVT